MVAGGCQGLARMACLRLHLRHVGLVDFED